MNHRETLRLTLAASAFAGILATDAAQAQQVLYTKNGNAQDRLGASVASAGDHDNNGRPDFVVGIPENFIILTAGEGRAQVYSGQNGNLQRTYNGTNFFEEFGSAVGNAGDINNDGFDDVVVGAPFANASASGRVQVFSGATGAVLRTFNGAASGDRLGTSVAGAGDVNNDGFDDIIAGAPFHNGAGADHGLTRVYPGANGAILWSIVGAAANDNWGLSVAGVGDVNLDGHDDFVSGSNSAGAKVYSGATGAVLFTFTAPDSDQLGRAVGAAGDVNNDGRPDIILGAIQDFPLTPGVGYAQVRSGLNGSVLRTVMGSTTGDRFGVSVDGAGDLNGDGFDDFMVGADQFTTDNGYVRVFSGVDGSLLFSRQSSNPAGNVKLGASVAGLGDVDGNGSLDLIVGAPLDSTTSMGNGSATVISYSGGTPCPPPMQYCVAGLNSQGTQCLISSLGSTSIANNDFVLRVQGASPTTFGIFYYGPTQIQTPVGNSFRCVGAGSVGLFRLYPPSMIDAGGNAFKALNYNTAPANQPLSLIAPGAVWNFQFFYRDGGAPNMMNFSNGLQVTFCP